MSGALPPLPLCVCGVGSDFTSFYSLPSVLHIHPQSRLQMRFVCKPKTPIFILEGGDMVPSPTSGKTHRYDVHNKFSRFPIPYRSYGNHAIRTDKDTHLVLRGASRQHSGSCGDKMAACAVAGFTGRGEERVTELAPRKTSSLNFRNLKMGAVCSFETSRSD